MFAGEMVSAKFTFTEPVGCRRIGALLLVPALGVTLKVANSFNCKVCVMTMFPLVAVMSTLKVPALTTALEATKVKFWLVPNPDRANVEEVGETVTPLGNCPVFTASVTFPEKPPTGLSETWTPFPNWFPMSNPSGEKKLMLNVGLVAMV